MPSSTAPNVSVVVPTRNSARTLECCLMSLRSQTVRCIIVVVDNSSTDETVSIAAKYAHLVLVAGPERSTQRNVGAAATSAGVVGFIDSDMVLSSSVVEEALQAINAGAVSVVVPEVTVGEGFWARVRHYERSLYSDVEAIEAPRFFERSVFETVGGFDESLVGPEDWDLARRTKSCGPRGRISSVIEHHEGRVRYLDACRKKAYYAPGMARYLSKHGWRAWTDMLHRPWLRPQSLATPLGIGVLALKVGEMAAVVFALARRSSREQMGNRS